MRDTMGKKPSMKVTEPRTKYRPRTNLNADWLEGQINLSADWFIFIFES